MSDSARPPEEVRNPDDLLPLKPDVFLILSILSQEARHGYGVMQAAEEWPGGSMEIQAGALYRRLKWMLNEGLIQEVESHEENLQGVDRRRLYRVTSYGRMVASREARRMEELLEAAAAVNLLLRPGGEGGA